MPYPSSFEVSAGDATLASQYNALRSDALFLGRAGTDAVTLAALLERYETRLKIERLNTDQLRVPASASEPVSLFIAGYMVQAVANVDLALEKKTRGNREHLLRFRQSRRRVHHLHPDRLNLQHGRGEPAPHRPFFLGRERHRKGQHPHRAGRADQKPAGLRRAADL